ncbi:MAG: NAD(P)/FAD-dependent oxidoreductase [Sandaracinaceae bacterium]
MTRRIFDAVLVGGGPANLAAALTLGRARRRTLLADAGPRRNAAATHVHNFLTRDGTPPDEMRRIARAQLTPYASVEARDEAVTAIRGERGAFEVELTSGTVMARRIVLGTGMIDGAVSIDGFAERWGHAIFQCPYCHGWEARDRPWAYLVTPSAASHMVPFALQALRWTDTLTVLTNGEIEVAEADAARLRARGIRLESAAVRRLVGPGRTLSSIELVDGSSIACEALFAHPPQRQVPLVQALELELDEAGYVRVHELRAETSRAGIFAAGDLTTPGQAAILAAGAGMRAAAMINMELALEG